MNAIRGVVALGDASHRVRVCASRFVAGCLPLIVAGLAAAPVLTGAAAAADKRIFLITAADRGGFGGDTALKVQNDEYTIVGIFKDQAPNVRVFSVPNKTGRISREGIDAQIAKVAAEIGPDDAVVFYYSGHGAFDEAQRELWFQLKPKGELVAYPRKDVRGKLLALRARLTVLLTDCCSAKMQMPTAPPGPLPVPNPSPLFTSLFFDTSGVVDITSSTPPELSWVSIEKPCSIFTWALAETLTAERESGNATWVDVFKSTRDLTVRQSTRESDLTRENHKHVPWLVRYQGTYRGKKIEPPAEIGPPAGIEPSDGRGVPPRPAAPRRFGLTMRWHDGGALVTAVEPGSPVDRAGIEPGDVIVRWGGVGPFESLEQLNGVVDASESDVVLTVINQHDGKSYEIRVQAGHRD